VSVEFFENVLKQISVQAFDALLTCGVRDLAGLINVSEKKLRQLGIKPFIITELMDIQHKINEGRNLTLVNETLQKKPTDLDLPSPPQRVRCHSRTSDQWLSDPANWSLLSRTLTELFWVTLPSSNAYAFKDDVTIGELGITGNDMCKFREIVFFPDDSADLLFSISLGYFLQVSISDEAFSIILDYFERLTGHQNLTKSFVSTAKVSDKPVFADIQVYNIENFRAPRLLCSDFLALFEDGKSMIYWRDLALISERNIIKHFGFTLKGLKAIKNLWQLKEHALESIARISNGLPIDAFSSFSNLVDRFVRSIIKKDYHCTVIMGRLGFLDEKKWTLEELGKRLNLTRERIRQIEKMYTPVLEKPKVLERLNLLWCAVDEVLTMGGGVCCVSEIANSLKNHYNWISVPSEDALASLISLSASYEVVLATPIRIIMPSHKCISCSEIGPILSKIVEGQASGTISFEKATAKMSGFCLGHACDTYVQINRFSNGFLHFLDDAIEEVLADENTLYTQYAWGQKYGGRRIQLVEIILRNAGRAMHFTEVHSEINKHRPEHGKISAHNIHAYLGRSPEILLWDRGTYIHRDYVSFPSDLIAQIENEIIRRLDYDIPYLSVSGIYKLFIDDLIMNRIPSESALYSCLRESSNKNLTCPDYPNIMKNCACVQRLPITLVLESFVLKQEGSVTYEDLRSYAVDTLCVNEAVFVGSHLQNIPNLLRMNRGEYIHLNQLAFDAGRFSPIIDHLTALLKTSNHVSAIKLYNDKKISCRLMGISTPMLLYSLIQLFYSDQFDLSRFPKICIAGHLETGSRTTGVASEVISYIREKGAPCSFAELYQHFVNELGYKQMSVYNVHFNSQVIRYSESVVAHLESLEWSEEKQASLELLASSHLINRESAGKPYGLVSHLYDYMHDELPEFPDQISWTPTVIGELLSTGGKYRIIGTPRNAFVAVPNSYSIETLDDLLHYLLDTEYDGAANIDQFISDMREAGVLKKSLTSIMLGEDSRVVIDGNVVKLVGLSDRVEGT